MIKIKTFAFNPFQENTYLLFDETGECAIIDPGCYDDFEEKELTAFIEEKKLKPVKLLNTHCHIDHIFGNKFISDKYKLGLEIHKLDLVVLKRAEDACKLYGIPGYEVSPEPEKFIDEGDEIFFGKSKLEILFVPGHAPGHIAFVNKEQRFIIGGDVLFYGSIGRTDFPGCDHDALIRSIKNKFYTLGDDFQVMPGHGPDTNIGFEKKNNPFVSG